MFFRRTTPSRDYGEIRGFLGEGTSFTGTLQFEGTVRLDGRFEGEVFGNDLLIIGEAAVVRADIRAGSLVVGGRVDGVIVVKQRAELLSTAHVSGSIKASSLVVGEGAILNGSCEMRREEPKVVRLDQKREDEAFGNR